MYNESFFPTPAEVADRMIAPFSQGELFDRTILEPSAGKGDLCDAINRRTNDGYSRRSFKKIHCCEIVPDLQAILKGKGHSLVNADFLSFGPATAYNLIVMNPPFANGEDHLLHAWKILHHGDIVCLLSTQSVSHVTTWKRQEVKRLIAEHGSVEHLGPCFQDAFRKTAVNVSLVRLHKKKEPIRFAIFGGMAADNGKVSFPETGDLDAQVAERDIIKTIVVSYDRALEVYRRKIPLEAEQSYYQRQLGKLDDNDSIPVGSFEERYNKFVQELTEAGWNQVLQRTKVRELLTRNMIREFDSQKAQLLDLAFTEENIRALLCNLSESGPEILKDCVLEAFDLMTRFHEENRAWHEGWKTNEAWKVNRRVVLPYGPRYESWRAEPSFYNCNELEDIDRALAYLNGKRLGDVETIIQAGKKTLAGIRDWSGRQFESTHFTCRCYQKGTIHLFFKDKDLWERFNLTAAEGKNWLPDDHKFRAKEDLKRNKWADQFGLTEGF